MTPPAQVRKLPCCCGGHDHNHPGDAGDPLAGVSLEMQPRPWP